jgi:hypothetical protein
LHQLIQLVKFLEQMFTSAAVVEDPVVELIGIVRALASAA